MEGAGRGRCKDAGCRDTDRALVQRGRVVSAVMMRDAGRMSMRRELQVRRSNLQSFEEESWGVTLDLSTRRLQNLNMVYSFTSTMTCWV